VDDDSWTFERPLLSERLLLRPHERRDLDDLVVFHGDERVTEFIPWPTRTREQTRVALEAKLDQTAARAEGEWIVLAIEERESGTVIGEVLLKRESEGAAEVGYVIRSDRQGRGLASEAVSTLLAAAEAAFGVRRIEAVVVTGNAASVRLLERLGFTRAAADYTASDAAERELLRFERIER
jgi:RimJ/RimL family protein N-acetyltransferase